MRQYRIWNDIQSCLYASSGGRTGNKSYGVKEHSLINMNVGTSSRNSHLFASIEQTVRELPNGDLSFRLFVDGKVIKAGIVSKKEKELSLILSSTLDTLEVSHA
tara:strand:+ start:110 stop:421 length:312 start_codon:yes stop_codon:yes gene_type:complete